MLAIASACASGITSDGDLEGGSDPGMASYPPPWDSGRPAPTPPFVADASSADVMDGGSDVKHDAGAADAGNSPRDAGTGRFDANMGLADAKAEPPDSARVETGAPADTSAPPAMPTFTLVVDAPVDGATLKNPAVVRGRASGFLNVEVWDEQHTNPPLGQATPRADGSFEISVELSALQSGAASWTVRAWDSPPGTAFDHEDSVQLQLTLDTGKPPDSPAGGTPDPGTRYVPGGYALAFSDEFTGSALDTGKWNTLAPWGVHFYTDSKQKQYFVPQAVTLAGGVVRFTAQRSNGGTEGQPFSSGSITTNGTFTHGYFEARAKVPSGKGFWPAYWLTSSTRWPPEWDIFEIVDGVIFGYPHPIESGKCTFVEGAAGSDSTYQIPNLYDTWHVYGFRWTASDVYWFVDGVLTEHYAIDAAAGANDPYWLNLSLQVGGDWPGDPDNSTPFPGVMEVDYVRVYQD